MSQNRLSDFDMLNALVVLTEKQVNTAHPELSEDLRQIGFESGMRALRTFDPTGGTRRRNWIITHLRRDMVRYMEYEAKHAGHIDIDELKDRDDVDELIDYEYQHIIQDKIFLDQLAESMSEEEATALQLSIFEDMTYEQIAERMSLNKQAVYRILTAAVAKIQRLSVLRNSKPLA